MQALKGTELFLTTDNKVGKLQEVSSALKAKGVNVTAVSAYAAGDKAFFRLMSSDNALAQEALKSLGQAELKEVVIVQMPDEVGQLEALSAKLKDAGIDLTYIYGTTGPGPEAKLVLSSNDNEKALQII